MMNPERLSLEDAVNNVNRLKADLSARVVVVPEQRYTKRITTVESICDQWCTGARDFYEDVDIEVIDPPITAPDNNKIKAAKNQLTEIYQSSEWYSARYAAGLALFKESQFKDNVGLWLRDIKGKLKAVSESYQIEIGSACGGWPGWDQPITETVDVPDDAARVNAVKDLGRLYGLSGISAVRKELKDAYACNESWAARLEAGEQLGYCRLRIRLHEIVRQ